MTTRRICAVLALSSALALGACTSSTSGKGQVDGSTPAGQSSAGQTPSSPSSGGKPTDAAGLGGLMQTAIAGIKTAHITLDINAAGQKVSGVGDEKMLGGKLIAMDLTENLPGGAGSIRLIIVDGKTYAKLPPSLNTSGKPYILVSPNSTNPTVKALAGSLDSALSSASLGSVGAFVTAAKSVVLKGTATVDGVQTSHYSIVVDIAKLPASLPGKDELSAGGLSTLPLELYIDDQGRPVQVTESLQVQGQSISTDVKVSDYNKPVSVTAPPASQVSTD
jgi:hypothetical protein